MVVTDGLAISFSAFDLGVAVLLVALVRALGLAA